MENPVRAALEMLRDGEDFESAQKLLMDLHDEPALLAPVEAPYSIGQVTAHALYWQNAFLAWAKGEEYEPVDTDWPDVTPTTWYAIRDAYLSGLDDAVEMATTGTGDPKQLLRVAVHGAYHLGQVATLRQQLGLWPVAGGTDRWDDPESDEEQN